MTQDNNEHTSIKSILSKLESGKKLTLSFPSPKERELFRVALYKAKREVDEVFLMTDSTFEPEVLCFEKQATLKVDGGITAEIYLTPKEDRPKRDYTFSIIEESEMNSPNGSMRREEDSDSP